MVSDKFRKWYIDFCTAEYGLDREEVEAAFEDAIYGYSDLGILYSSFDDDDCEYNVEVSIDFVRNEETIYRDGLCVYRHRYTLPELEVGFVDMSWDDIYAWAVSICRDSINEEKGETA